MGSASFADHQYEIYRAGLSGERPKLPLSIRGLQQKAKEVLTPEAFDYVAGGAGSEDTMRANRMAFRRWRIVPHVLRDVGHRDLSAHLLGIQLPAPILLAPIAAQSIMHPDAELAVARAAASVGVPMVLSTVSSKTIEEVADAMGEIPLLFQLYWPSDMDLAASFISRAEKAGYRAIVVTLDSALLGWRPRDLQRAYLPFLGGEGLANYFSDPVFRNSLDRPPEEDPQAAVTRFISVFSNPTVTWEDLGFLREHTSLPIVLKGILHPADARRAADGGVDAIIVSNHGGRQVDGAIASLDALPGILEVVGMDFPILLDSGIRTGADAFKAIALGAQAVLLGRPYVWGLAVGGEDGVRGVLQAFMSELDLTLALSGYTSFRSVSRSALERES
jgi:lactate 2-monooxygenase